MTLSVTERAASHLLAARRGRVRLTMLDAHPQSLAEAHAVQDRLAGMAGMAIGGWKAGFSDGDVMRGAILAPTMLASGSSYTPDVFTVGYEGELAFRLKRDLPPREAPYSRDEVMAATAIMPAIEIVASRFALPEVVPALDRVADNNLNGGFVSGPEIADWRDIDIANLAVSFAVDGEPVFARTGGHPAGDPFAPAVALANALRSGGGMRAGQIVTTGAPTGCQVVRAGAEITVAFDHVGAVTLSTVAN